MKKTITLLLVFLTLTAWSQEDAWIFLNAKPESSTFINNPLSMLTQRALDRRAAQNIAVDFLDVPVHQPFIDQIENAPGIEVKAKSKWYNALHVRGSQANIAALANLSFVANIRYANPSLNIGDRIAPAHSNIKNVNKTFETTVDFSYGQSANQIEMLNGHLLHQQNYTGAGKIIAVMDGGFPGVDTAAPFSRLQENGLILGGYDYVNRSANFYSGISHGTLVLATMGGYKEDELVGTAPDAAYYLFITEDGNNESPLEESLWVEAAEEADRLGVDIITTSLGYSTFDNESYSHTYADMDGSSTFISQGLNFAFSRGMVCVVSAGNSGGNDWYYITAPADATSALAVGAVDPDGDYVSFSSHGPSFDGRVKPDVAAQGRFAVVSNVLGDISTANGTSFACPIIAGMIASFWQAVPQLTNTQVMQFVKQSSSIYSNPNDDIGYGIPNFANALEDALQTQIFPRHNDFAIYPNPAGELVFIQSPVGDAQITFFNAIGQKVLQQYVSGKDVIAVGQLESGLYMYQVEANGFSQRGKLIKK